MTHSEDQKPTFSELRPIQVAAVEALVFTEEWCSASDLKAMLAPAGFALSQLAYHLGKLNVWGYVVRSERLIVPGILEGVYALPRRRHGGG